MPEPVTPIPRSTAVDSAPAFLRDGYVFGQRSFAELGADAFHIRLLGQPATFVLAALSCVDYVTTFETDTPAPLLELLEPEIYVKGGDYSPDMLAETRVVEGYGGQVRILDYLRDHSTTAVVAKIREQGS